MKPRPEYRIHELVTGEWAVTVVHRYTDGTITGECVGRFVSESNAVDHVALLESGQA